MLIPAYSPEVLVPRFAAVGLFISFLGQRGGRGGGGGGEGGGVEVIASDSLDSKSRMWRRWLQGHVQFKRVISQE